ncbi:hypothetical protein EDB89DRAFT_1907951 [Lactarius sanguifluus]|nr:hypothetical protein EDB89DRAFT_1907951 [Lactarius sanguifluus]
MSDFLELGPAVCLRVPAAFLPRSRRRGRLAFGFALALLLKDQGTGAAAAHRRGAVAEAARDKTRGVFDGRLDLLYRKVRFADPFWVSVIKDSLGRCGPRTAPPGVRLPPHRQSRQSRPTVWRSGCSGVAGGPTMPSGYGLDFYFIFTANLFGHVTGWLSSRSKTRSHIELLATLHRVDVPEEVPRRSSELGRIVRDGPGVGARNSTGLEHDPRHFGRQVRSSFSPSPESAGTGRRRYLNHAPFPSAFRSGATWLSCSSGTASGHHDADKRRSPPSAASHLAHDRGK